jgi:hypothetical protein
MLFILKLKENNMPAPDMLKNAVDQIGHQCFQLVGLAKGLAQGYEEYPDIQAQLYSEAAGLDSSAQNLVSTCSSIPSEHCEKKLILRKTKIFDKTFS